MKIHNHVRPLTVEEINNLPEVDNHNIKKAAIVLRAFDHKLRQRIIKIIHESKQLTVTQILVSLRLEQSVASQHLAILRRAGIVSAKREGQFIFYTANYVRIEQINQFARNLIVK